TAPHLSLARDGHGALPTDAAANQRKSLHRRLGGAALPERSRWRLHLEVRSGHLAALFHRRYGGTAEGDTLPHRRVSWRAFRAAAAADRRIHVQLARTLRSNGRNPSGP